jgi:hypothetical protein
VLKVAILPEERLPLLLAKAAYLIAIFGILEGGGKMLEEGIDIEVDEGIDCAL